MTWRIAGLLLGVVAATPGRPGPQVFRSSADAVLVDVSVTRDGQQVWDLAAGDFEIWDNGVKQTIALTSAERMPIDLTVLIDVSHSAANPFEGVRSIDALLPASILAVGDLKQLLLSHDQLRLRSFASISRDVASASALVMPSDPDLQHTALWDAVGKALMLPAEPGRRHIVAALTDGMDTASVLDYPTLWRIAARSDAVLYLFSIASFRHSPPGGVFAFETFTEYYAWVLDEAARQTTGGYFDTRSPTEAVARFATLLQQYRQRYLLSYVPAGVQRNGWHDIKVSVTKRGKFTIAARRGYYWSSPTQ